MKLIEKNNKKGITLIALVITIIVLLILAGVSISMLTGDNSLLGNAQKTGPANNIGAAKDEVGLAYNTAMQEYYETKYASTNSGSTTFEEKLGTAINEITEKGRNHGCTITYTEGKITITNGGYKVIGTVDTTDGSAGISWGEMKETTGIDLDKVTLKLNISDASKKTGTLTATLSKISGDITWTSSDTSIATVSGSDKTATVTGVATGETTITATCSANGKEYSSTCKVTVTNGQVVGYDDIVNNPKDYYGKAVKNYTLTDKTADGKDYIFRIFYAGNDIDEGERIYLKADPCDSTKLSSYTNYSPKTTTYLKNHNKSWASERLSKSSSWNANEHCAAWLCNPDNFTKYITTGELASKVKYVIGAPGIEMYAKSYNQTHPNGYTNESAETYKDLKATYTSGDYGYKYAFGTESASSYTSNNSIDNSGFKQMYYTSMWLASPSAAGGDGVCSVYGRDACLSGINYDSTYSLAPLVSLSSDVQLQI